MGEFFGSMYCLFEDFFGNTLADYLWGLASPLQITNMYIGIGFSMLGISLLVMLIFYYGINNRRLNHWWGWGIFLFANIIINFIVGWQWVLRHLYEGTMIAIDPETNMEVPLNIDEADCLCFGVSNMLLSIASFFIFSMLGKWFSSNCSNAPFVK